MTAIRTMLINQEELTQSVIDKIEEKEKEIEVIIRDGVRAKVTEYYAELAKLGITPLKTKLMLVDGSKDLFVFPALEDEIEKVAQEYIRGKWFDRTYHPNILPLKSNGEPSKKSKALHMYHEFKIVQD